MIKNIFRLKYLPILCFIWLIATFLISYAIAASLGHVHPVWPYISDTGTTPPDSCIFGLMLNIGALFMAMVLFVRYEQLKILLKNHEKWHKALKILNIFCLVTGMLASFGVCVVANFQETSNMAAHLIGANLGFGVGTGYFIVHTILCFLISKDSISLNIARAILCIIYVISFALTLIYAKMAFGEWNVAVDKALLWSPDDPGYNYRLVSTFSEWILGLCLGLYILSFSYEFRGISFEGKFTVHEKLRGQNTENHIYS